MPIRTDWIQFGDHAGCLAAPAGCAGPLPSVLVIPELWGLDAHIEDLAGRLAMAGYRALAVDLHWHRGARPEAMGRERVGVAKAFLNALPATAWRDPAARGEALGEWPGPDRAALGETVDALFAQLGDPGRFLPVLRAAVRHLKTEGGRVASVGFCMGGGLSALLACEEPELDAAAIFYGSAPPLEKIPAIRCPVTGFYGGLDLRINAGLPAFAKAMAEAGREFTYRVYEGAPHAFFNDTRPSYHVGAARDAYARLLEFLRRSLAG